ncbi:hypothetical protein SETIT_9G394100v2 [Setaria italica]|uniref:Uncharacterized protein n=1 Tax=Setaria italica TaxID=4555 RepID=A0A368SQF9_SETIT|nr:hypothetical protein SETIT_9G394100v2 [Setaria italica]
MTLYSGKELKLIPLVLASLLLLMQFQSVSCSSSCCFHQRGGLLRGRRLLMGRHGEAIFAKGLMEPVVAKEGGGALREEDKREVITGPNPLHNRR